MISIITGTNKYNSIARKIADLISSMPEETQLLDIMDIKPSNFGPDMYKNQSSEIGQLQDKYLIGADKWIFILPEYNGTFPGYFKLFIDACSVRNYMTTFATKKICLIGYASGRAGNLRGLDHICTSFTYLGCNIYPNTLCISQIESQFDSNGNLNDSLVTDLTKLVKGFNAF